MTDYIVKRNLEPYFIVILVLLSRVHPQPFEDDAKKRMQKLITQQLSHTNFIFALIQWAANII